MAKLTKFISYFLMAVSITAILAGCASPKLSVIQSSFQQWPNSVTATTYHLDPSLKPNENLEVLSVAQQIKKELSHHHLTPVGIKVKAPYVLSFSYGQKEETIQDEHITMIPNTFLSPFLGFGMMGSPFFFGTGLGFTPVLSVKPVTVYHYFLEVTLKKSHSGVPVFQSKATTMTGESAFALVMPLLVQSALKDFPGKNGQQQRILFTKKDNRYILKK